MRIVKKYIELICKKYNLIIVNINETKYHDGNFETIVDCMNEENKFLKFKVIEKIKSINGDLYSQLTFIK